MAVMKYTVSSDKVSTDTVVDEAEEEVDLRMEEEDDIYQDIGVKKQHRVQLKPILLDINSSIFVKIFQIFKNAKNSKNSSSTSDHSGTTTSTNKTVVPNTSPAFNLRDIHEKCVALAKNYQSVNWGEILHPDMDTYSVSMKNVLASLIYLSEVSVYHEVFGSTGDSTEFDDSDDDGHILIYNDKAKVK